MLFVCPLDPCQELFCTVSFSRILFSWFIPLPLSSFSTPSKLLTQARRFLYLFHSLKADSTDSWTLRVPRLNMISAT